MYRAGRLHLEWMKGPYIAEQGRRNDPEKAGDFHRTGKANARESFVGNRQPVGEQVHATQISGRGAEGKKFGQHPLAPHPISRICKWSSEVIPATLKADKTARCRCWIA